MPLICTPIQARTQSQVLKKWKALRGKTDLVEIWLDRIQDLDLPSLLHKKPLARSRRSRPLPVICRGKKALEAGQFGADYVDIPYSLSFRPSRRRAEKSIAHNSTDWLLRKGFLRFGRNDMRRKLILSYHNFKKTPSRNSLLKKAQAMKKRGADIVKIAVQARTLDDCLSVILLAQELKHLHIPHILIAMGKKGRLSRILTPHVGGTLMFAPIKKSEATAPGQLTVKELRKAWKLIKS